MLKNLFPPKDSDGNPITNNVTRVVYPDWWTNGTPAKPINSASFTFANESYTNTNTFTVQYGLSLELVPWASSGSNFTQSAEGDITYIQNDETNAEYTVVMPSGWTFHSYNRADTEDAEFDWRETIQPSTVVIFRSTNLTDWSGIFTNSACGRNTVETYVDRDAPPTKAFYWVLPQQLIR